MTVDAILARAAGGGRVSVDEAVRLFAAPLLALGMAADARCRAVHPGAARTFVIGRNINYTNVCASGCRFCAFFRGAGHREAYVLAVDDVLARVGELVAIGGTEVLLQGGLHQGLRLAWYEDLFRAVAQAYPTAWLHALSPGEIWHLADLEAMPVAAVLERLVAAGLRSIPGGGAEILVDRVRATISPRKCSADAWLDVMRAAHRLGLPTTATMMYGHVETLPERIEHLRRLRDLQDETGGFLGFIPWPFQPGNTPLARHAAPDVGGQGFLRMLAISRLFLDNIPHLQSSWVTQGLALGHLGLPFGADDLGSVMMEELVVSAAGATHRATTADLARHIADLGFTPVQRDTGYGVVNARFACGVSPVS